MAKIKTFQILELKSQNCRKNLLIDFPFFYLRNGFPLLFGDQRNEGAFDKILILGVEN